MSLTKVTYAMVQNGVFNVKDYGAIGDGTANDTAAILAAIAAAETNLGGTVYFPCGSYAVSATITPTSLAIPITFKGDGKYETTQGTRIKWIGGNNDSILKPPSYATIQDMFIYNSNSSTGLIGIDMLGTGLNPLGRVRCVNVDVKDCASGWAFEQSYYNELTSCSALYNNIGFDLRQEANAITFINCSANVNAKGISDENVAGGGARSITWMGGTFEGNTTAGINISASSLSTGWVFNGAYFEDNYQTAVLRNNVELIAPFINADGVSGGVSVRPAIDIAASRGIRITNLSATNSVTDLFTFSGGTNDYLGSGTYISQTFNGAAFSNSFYNDLTPFVRNYYDPNTYSVLETEWFDASVSTARTLTALNNGNITNKRPLVAAYLIVDTAIVPIASNFKVGMGRNVAFDDTATDTYTTTVTAGTYSIPIVASAPDELFPFSFVYKTTYNAATSGLFKFQFVFA
jgi:hypothetical protein